MVFLVIDQQFVCIVLMLIMLSSQLIQSLLEGKVTHGFSKYCCKFFEDFNGMGTLN